MPEKRVLVISAHAVDFVWRCGGTIAQYTKNGYCVKIIDITCGARGESNNVWAANPQITEEEVTEIRKEEAKKSAEILGAEIEFLDWSDHLLTYDRNRVARIAEILKIFHPQIVLTHWISDPLNYDHPNTANAVLMALRLAQVRGAVRPDLPPIDGTQVFLFEPDQPDFCDFKPDTYIDITEVMNIKKSAMSAIHTQAFLVHEYIARGEYRAYLARRQSGNSAIEMAEAFKRFNLYVGTLFPQ